jgi:protein phosphatase
MITDPEQVVQQLIDLAYQVGAPDNIACVVADVVSL